MSQPAFVPERREIWFSDATGGFYALRVTNGAWPAKADGGACRRPAKLGFKLHRVEGTRVVRVACAASSPFTALRHFSLQRSGADPSSALPPARWD